MSSHKERSRKSSDPYAGQYPPPPPLNQEDLSMEQNHIHEPFYIINPNSSHSISAADQTKDNRQLSSYDESIEIGGDYEDPEAIDLKEYLYAERQEKLQRKQQQQQQQQQQHRNSLSINQQSSLPTHYQNDTSPFYSLSISPTRFNSVPTHNLSSSTLLPPPLPILFSQPPPPPPPPPPPNFMTPPVQPPFVLPSLPPPSLPIINNQEKYDYRKQSGCCCFGISFCACFWTLLLFIILLGGVALIIIATKYVSDVCDHRQTILCGKVLYHGLLYGGIVIAGISGLIFSWRVLHWFTYRGY